MNANCEEYRKKAQIMKVLAAFTAVFLLCFFLPVEKERSDNPLFEAIYLVTWYTQEHVLLCIISAFFIAGAIGVFISQTSVMKYLGAGA